MAISEEKLNAILNEYEERISVLEEISVALALGILISLNAAAFVAKETGLVEEFNQKDEVESKVRDYLKNVRPAGSA